MLLMATLVVVKALAEFSAGTTYILYVTGLTVNKIHNTLASTG